MTQLYITFFVIGLLIFSAIALYSWFLLQNSNKKKDQLNDLKKQKYDDPIFTETHAANKSGTDSIDPSFDGNVRENQTNTNESKGAVSKPLNKVLDDSSIKNLTKTSKTDSNKQSLPVVEMSDKIDGSVDSESSKDTEFADNVEIINVQPKRDKGTSSIVTELVARIKNSESIEQEKLLAVFRNHDFKFHRSVHLYGLNQLTDLWRDIEFELPSARFVELGVAIQLADRDGAMTQKELHDFQQMALEFSNHLDAPFEFSMDIDEALMQSRVLDEIGRRYDSMAVLNVVPRSKTGFRMADVESCARDLGMTRSKNGIFLKTVGQKNQISILYRLACTNSKGDFGLSSGNAEPIYDLVIYMSVPATQTPETVFQSMVKDANSLATWLEGKVVDKDGAVMTQRTYTVLTQQISDISFSMQQDGLVPGDSVCKKLF